MVGGEAERGGKAAPGRQLGDWAGLVVLLMPTRCQQVGPAGRIGPLFMSAGRVKLWTRLRRRAEMQCARLHVWRMVVYGRVPVLVCECKQMPYRPLN